MNVCLWDLTSKSTCKQNLLLFLAHFYTSKLLVHSLNSSHLPSTYLFAHNCDLSWRLQFSDLCLLPLFLIKDTPLLTFILHQCSPLLLLPASSRNPASPEYPVVPRGSLPSWLLHISYCWVCHISFPTLYNLFFCLLWTASSDYWLAITAKSICIFFSISISLFSVLFIAW